MIEFRIALDAKRYGAYNYINIQGESLDTMPPVDELRAAYDKYHAAMNKPVEVIKLPDNNELFEMNDTEPATKEQQDEIRKLATAGSETLEKLNMYKINIPNMTVSQYKTLRGGK